jgi:RNA polymerase sigma factor for flagellar operon FliA
MSQATPQSARELFESQLPLIHDLIRYVSRRHHLRQEDEEDFSSYTLLKLMEDDYGTLRSFQGRSSLRTYLTVVIQRLFLDFRIQKWGKWRPTAEVQRLGRAAVELDRLLSRDGQTLANAVEILHTSLGGTFTREDLVELAGRLPQRQRLQYEGDNELDRIPTDGGAEERLLGHEREMTAKQITAALSKALQELPAEDRLILRMRYEDGFTIRDIATALHLEPRPLYSRFEKCHRRLRESLEGQGVTWSDVEPILGWTGTDLRLDLECEEEGSVRCPSNRSDDLPPQQRSSGRR